MEWYLICILTILLTLLAKGFTVFRVERLRAGLARCKREAQEAKRDLLEIRKRHQDLQRSFRAKEVRIGKLKKEIDGLERRVQA